MTIYENMSFVLLPFRGLQFQYKCGGDDKHYYRLLRGDEDRLEEE